jgi:signal transduction histidine kinase
MAQLRFADGSSRFEWICRNSSGAEFPIEAFSSTVEIGGRTLALAILQDISERKRAERELRNALERERELSQLKSSFISMVSHEYRNPLGIILSSTELLKRYHDRLSEAEKLESLIDIEVATRRMAVMIDNMLMMGKADAGKLVMVPKPVDLLEFCQVAINESLSSNDSQRIIRLESQGIDTFATTDEQLLRIILSNLLTNALKYSPPDRSPSLTVSRVGRHAIFKIHDDGIGIPDEDRPALFQAFRRARNVGVVNGTGLGLYIVKHCVDLHAGTIELESAVGNGTTVTVMLPMFSSTTEPRSSTSNSRTGR